MDAVTIHILFNISLLHSSGKSRKFLEAYILNPPDVTSVKSAARGPSKGEEGKRKKKRDMWQHIAIRK